MSDSEYEKYDRDSRVPCKYGVKCYQKNSLHLEKYKHPPKKVLHTNTTKPPAKKMKLEVDDAIKEVAVQNDDSESDVQRSPTKKTVKITNDVSESDESDAETKRQSSEVHLNAKPEPDNKLCGSPKVNTLNVNNDVSGLDESDPENKIESTGDHERHEADDDCKSGNTPAGKIIPENTDVKAFIKEKFLVDMPEDFYNFWDFVKKLKPSSPLEALKDIGLTLVGPYDVLAGKFFNIPVKRDAEYLLHWRYYYDVPEFQTVLKGDDKSGYHIGYFRDDPCEPPALLASNCGMNNGIFTLMGGNIFAALSLYLEELKKTGDPFKKMHVGRFNAAIKAKAGALKLDLGKRPTEICKRESKIVTRTFNKIGLVVPFNKKTELGYRELTMDNKQLYKVLDKIKNATNDQKSKFLSQLQPVLTYASIATDECDFGTGIELGWNIMCHGVASLNSTALGFLTSSYRLLNREVFAKIAEAHLENRRKGCKLSIL